MPINYYPRPIWDETKLLSELKSVTEASGRGRISEVIAANVRTSREFQGGPSADETVKRIRYSLYVLGQAVTDADLKASNLDLYPNPYTEKIMRVETRRPRGYPGIFSPAVP